jgi:hypothetical protein
VATLLTLAAFASAFQPHGSDEDKVPLDQLPKPILDALKKQFPKAKLIEASKEVEKDKTEFEVTIKDGSITIDVTLTPDGTILGLEKELETNDLPKAVKETLEGKYPKATYETVEGIYSVKDGKEHLEHYEILVVTGDKKRFEVEVSVAGKIIKTEEKKKEKDKKE